MLKLSEFKSAISNEDIDKACKIADELKLLLSDRNEECQMLL